MCAKGAARANLADGFGVNDSTIDTWILEYVEFSQAHKFHQDRGDDSVERAVGYTYDCIKLMVRNGESVRDPLKEHVPPDTRAGEFWMRNRRPERWKDLKQLETSTAKDDPFTAYLRRINGRILRPVDPYPATIEGEYKVVGELSKTEVAPPPRPIADE